ncbi:MAG TPA: RnfABCDGE type electron transport complex subunit B [Clostridia bacterium]|nr:RnfABCDGE type electron transport complex subunit B [Clostridia bacterium]
MNWLPVILAFAVMGAMGLAFGVMLSIADKKLAVETDPRVARVREALGGANCGACGCAGCDAFADALVCGKVKPSDCPVGSAKAIGKALGVECEESEKKVARVLCQGHEGVAKERYEYDGYASCSVAAGIAGGPKLCTFSCLGLGDCEKACAFGAIHMEKNLAHIDPALCVACGKCVDVCPRAVIRLVPAREHVLVLCQNSDTGRVARAACMRACIACGRCQKECKYGAIDITKGFAVIDQDKCTRCGACAKVCPCDCIVDYAVHLPEGN